jgi:hypothetical protein
MARGAVAKAEIIEKILEVFEDSFAYNDGKEVRINTVEDGEPIQIKLALTAAKVAVEKGDDAAVPGSKPPKTLDIKQGDEPAFNSTSTPVEATQEEKARLADIMAELGI